MPDRAMQDLVAQIRQRLWNKDKTACDNCGIHQREAQVVEVDGVMWCEDCRPSATSAEYPENRHECEKETNEGGNDGQ